MKNKFNKSGFTLIEILVVIGIIGLLSSITMIAVNNARSKAKIAKAQQDIDVIYSAIGQLMIDTGEWPGHQIPDQVNTGANNEVWDLTTQSSGITQTDGLFSNWAGAYMLSIPSDPWGNNYFFDTDYEINLDNEPCDGGGGCFDSVVVGSFGANGVGQNQYDSDDVIKVVNK